MKSITLRKTLAFLIVITFILIVFFARSVFKPLILSIILAYILSPIVNRLEKTKLNKRLSALLVVILVLGAFILIAIYIIPGIIRELMGILNNFEDLDGVLKRIMDFIGYEGLPPYLREVVNNTIIKIQTGLSNSINVLFERIFEFAMELPTYFLAPIFIYYFLADKEFFKGKINYFIPLKFREKAFELSGHINRVIQGYFLSQVLLSLLVLVLTFIVLMLIGIRFPLVLAILNGIANFIPYFGPIIGYIPALLFSLTESPDKVIMVTIAFFMIQQIEANIVSPKIVSDCTGMHPVEVMIVLLVGGYFLGVIGMVLSVPFAATVKISYRYVVR